MPSPLEALLADVPLFADLSTKELAALSRRCNMQAYPRGAALVVSGGACPGIFAVVEGAVRLSLHDGDREERVVRLVGAGESFCAASTVLDRAAPYHATALVATKAILVPASAVRALLAHEAPFARRLAEELAARELELCAEIRASAFQSSAQRLASYIAGLAGDASKLRLPYSKTLIAARLGMKKETLSRLLRRFAADGVIAMARNEISILDPQRLRAAGGTPRGAAKRPAAARAAGSVPGAARRTADQAAG
jgi:CRP-like cAMP-binding protein